MICPYVETSLGGFFGVQDIKGTNGFYFKIGAGIEYFRFSFSAGYKLFSTGNLEMNYGYIKAGFRIGR